MKRLIDIIICIIAVISCEQETAVLPEVLQDETRYVNVGVVLEDSGTKSVINEAAEMFNSAILFAYDKDSGEILYYNSNAGNLSGNPIIKYTSASSFSWPLPTSTEMKIYCIINPPESLVAQSESGTLNTEQALLSCRFVCTDAEALAGLETSSSGLPKSGSLDIGIYDFTEDNASLSIGVKNLFAKYRLTMDTGTIPEDAAFRVLKVKVFSANTSVPYFDEGFRQTSHSLLKDFDYATETELEKLSNGGEQNSIVLYTLENCQGTRSGAISWSSVREDYEGLWEDINLCTRLLVEYSLNGKVYVKEVFLGEGDMKTDFNVRRNLYKSIVMRPGEETSALSPFFAFNEDVFYAHPGEFFRSEDRAVSTNLESVTFSITRDGGVASGFYNFGLTGGILSFMVAPDTPVGEYVITGGKNEEFYWDTYGTTVAAVTDKSRVIVSEQINLHLQRETDPESIYPYLPVNYLSEEFYTVDKAESLAGTIRFVSLPDNIDSRYTSISTVQTPDGYRISLSVCPSRPGTMESFTIRYGNEGKTCAVEEADVLAPEVVVWNESCNIPANTEEGRLHIDVMGNSVQSGWRLCKQGGTSILPSPLSEELVFTLSRTDRFNTNLSLEIVTSTPTSRLASICLAGFDNLPEFDEDNYSFEGLTFQLRGTFTYPGGYSVSKTIDAVIDNPLEGYSYDGKTYEYEIHQGRTEQGDHISVVNADTGDSNRYFVENMLSWPQRVIKVDLTRGGTRGCNKLEYWTEYSCLSGMTDFRNSAGSQQFLVVFNEDFGRWGPVYYGKIVKNYRSNEKRTFVHSIIRIYNHYNVFAVFDAQEKNCAHQNWDNLSGVKWSWSLLNYHFGGFRAELADSFDSGPHGTLLRALVSKDITSATMVKPILSGYVLDTGGKVAAHGKLSAGAHDDYQVYSKKGSNDPTHYVVGYYSVPSACRYFIYYDWLYIDGVDNSCDPIYWRNIASNNPPWFKVSGGDFQTDNYYVSSVNRTGVGEYNLSIIPSGSVSSLSRYKDSKGRGYQFIHPYWEGKEGKYRINSRTLSPTTGFDASLTLVNGWYNPALYSNGIPVLKLITGMYFFPDGSSSPGRAGYPGYYSNDAPYSLSDNRMNMEIGLEYGNLSQRDRDAAR
ncbi:MAG: DUF4906 domain-containing protein [Bacteroidales bacterium]|nr:DUF4906 domain-containing protein [Bacteroidales bacterium]